MLRIEYIAAISLPEGKGWEMSEELKHIYHDDMVPDGAYEKHVKVFSTLEGAWLFLEQIASAAAEGLRRSKKNRDKESPAPSLEALVARLREIRETEDPFEELDEILAAGEVAVGGVSFHHGNKRYPMWEAGLWIRYNGIVDDDVVRCKI